jgi:DNA-binding CsgD family transcriptional regulator
MGDWRSVPSPERRLLQTRCPAQGRNRGELCDVPDLRGLSAAELRLLPTHLPLTQVAAELFLLPRTIRAQAKSIYRKPGTPSRSHAVAGPGSSTSWTADRRVHSLSLHLGDGTCPGRPVQWIPVVASGDRMG